MKGDEGRVEKPGAFGIRPGASRPVSCRSLAPLGPRAPLRIM